MNPLAALRKLADEMRQEPLRVRGHSFRADQMRQWAGTLDSAIRLLGEGKLVAWRRMEFGNWHYAEQEFYDSEPLYASPVPPAVVEGCLWEPEDDPDVSWWNTSCGQAWSFTTDGPKENGMNFCHYCGKPLRLNPERTNG